MRRRVWTAWGLLALGIGLGFAGRATDARALDMLSGACLVAAVVVALSLLSFWGRMFPPLPRMRGLFPPVAAGQRWCDRCGRVAERGAACTGCGDTPRPPRRVRRQGGTVGRSG